MARRAGCLWEFGDAVVATAFLDRLLHQQPRADDHRRELPAARETPRRRTRRARRGRGAACAGVGVTGRSTGRGRRGVAHPLPTAPPGAVRSAARAPWISSVRRYRSPRLLMPSSSVGRPPVDRCRATSPSHAAISRPLRNSPASPNDATSAVAVSTGVAGARAPSVGASDLPAPSARSSRSRQNIAPFKPTAFRGTATSRPPMDARPHRSTRRSL